MLVRIGHTTHRRREGEIKDDDQWEDQRKVGVVEVCRVPDKENSYGCASEIIEREPRKVLTPDSEGGEVLLKRNRERNDPAVQREVGEREHEERKQQGLYRYCFILGADVEERLYVGLIEKKL